MNIVARSRRRVLLVQGVGLSLMLLLGGRLFYLQALDSDAYAAAADANTTRQVVSAAPRGLILDDLGRPLVRNRTILQVTLDRSELARQPGDGAAVLDRLAAVLGTDVEALRTRIRPCAPGVPTPCWNGSPYEPVPVATDVEPALALQILEHREQFPGVETVPITVRSYPAPAGANLAHVLGYLQPADVDDVAAQRSAGLLDPRLGSADLVGRAGLEKQYDALLRGTPGVRQVTVDHLGHVLTTVDETDAVPGHNLVTTIDAQVQAVAEKVLAEAITRAHEVPDYRGRTYAADSGAIVVMDVTDGSVVAMAGAPTYDPLDWVGGIDHGTYARLTAQSSGSPLLARPFAAASAPGSLMKVISVAAAAENGYDLNGRYECPSYYRIGDQTFTNFESAAHGWITLARALEVSCDTVFYKIAHEMWLRDGGDDPIADPQDPMQRMAAAFGLGRPTGIDLPGEIPGRISLRDFKRSYWERTREATCARAQAGPSESSDDPERSAYLHRLDVENCADGARFRAGDAVNFAIGQGDTAVTPLQMARVYAAIANGGTLWQPRVAKAELDVDGQLIRTFDPRSDGEVGVSDEVLDHVRGALLRVSTNGTAAGVFGDWPLSRIPVGAKTGTAERYSEDPSSWFVGFTGPAQQKPRYVVLMTVAKGGTGSGTSGPGVREVLSALVGVGRDPVFPGALPPAALPIGRFDAPFGRAR
ncbi:penicillin-binding protein 2 [Sporichthya sp.]|uniref:penicillin-binding protein 2 n=1 Tax=Sporichthya sp. TaxID=65475 RepID=UPI00181F0A03|nr:penicillin-binding protein 2 [Sporichthya sp.]MBA3744153.1 penicillin-binding protein 2 [Sporichthya sp.]